MWAFGLNDVPSLFVPNLLPNTVKKIVFGRRLGTNSDGTSLRPNAHLEGTLDVSNDFRDPFSSNTRDLTITREGLTIDYLSRPRNIIVDNSGVRHDVRSGYAYGGPRYGTLNKYANTVFGTSATGSYANTFQNLNQLRVTGTKTALDGQPVPIFLLTSNEIGKKLSMKYAFPTQTSFNANLFSNTLVRFDGTNITFDDTNP